MTTKSKNRPKWFKPTKGHAFSDTGLIHSDCHNIHVYIWDILEDSGNLDGAKDLSEFVIDFIQTWYYDLPADFPREILYAHLFVHQDITNYIVKSGKGFKDGFGKVGGTLHVIDTDHNEYFWTGGRPNLRKW